MTEDVTAYYWNAHRLIRDSRLLVAEELRRIARAGRSMDRAEGRDDHHWTEAHLARAADLLSLCVDQVRELRVEIERDAYTPEELRRAVESRGSAALKSYAIA